MNRPSSPVDVVRSVLQASVALVPWQARTFIKRMPLVAPMQRWLLARFVDGHEFVHTVDAGPARGLRYPIKMPDDKGVWTGTYELGFSESLARAVRPQGVCFDIGGFRGFFSGVMALAGASRVVTFEPFPANCTRIRNLLALNPQLPIELQEVAVGENEGTTEFLQMPESSMGKLADSPFQREGHADGRIVVRVVTLDGLVSSGALPAPSLIKIDIEGAELMALKGAQHTLRTHKPTLFMEIHSRELARTCHEFLRGLGYRVTVMETGAPPDGHTEPEVCHFEASASSAEAHAS